VSSTDVAGPASPAVVVERSPDLLRQDGSAGSAAMLEPYVPRLVVEWLRDTPGAVVRAVDGSLAFVDISGFTTLTERLARKGRIGAEEISDLLNATFAQLLEVAYRDGAGLVKWGGDAVLLLFTGDHHAVRACRAAHRMRARIRHVGQLRTTAGQVTLRMSVGIHSDRFLFFLVGDPDVHRELLVAGPAASRTAELEALADAGDIAISAQTAAALPPHAVGVPKGDGLLLAAEPRMRDLTALRRPPPDGLDIGSTIPVAIREHLLQAAGEAEHRQIAVAFVEFSGTDALLAERGADVLAAALDETIRNVQHAAAAHDVTFFETDINRDGGKIMLTAGAPRSADHDEERMLRAARRIMDRVGVLPLRIGINRGGVFAGDFGPPFRRTYSVKGDAVNLAARVMAKAAAGQVLATAAVVQRSGTVFDVQRLAPFTVKGKQDAVDAFSIGAVTGERAGGSAATRLVGREAELAELRRALDVARSRAGRLVEVVGEPGIGKSRLVAELTAAATDLTVVAVTCDEFESSTAYHPFRSLLRDVLGVPREASDELTVQRLVRRVEFNAPELLPWLPLVGVVLDVPMLATAATDAVAERFRKARVEEATAALLSVLLPTPTVLVMEDVHLMDRASADLLERVAADLARRPWLLLVTRRDQDTGFRPDSAPGRVTLRPGPLPRADAMDLVLETLADAPLPPHVLADLARRAEGNPLFLRGLAVAAASGQPLDALPDSVEALVTSQIDRLPPDERTVLRYASVLGVQFRETHLRAILAGHELPTGRTTLRRLSYFLRPTGHGGFRFEHALIRDAAYQGMPYRRRRELHGRAGELIEASARDSDEVSELLSLHYFHAGMSAQAWHWSRVAGERAQAKHASAEVVQLLGRAAEVAQVLEELGDAQTAVGSFPAALQSYRGARRLAVADPLRAAGLLRKQALVDQRLDRLPQAMATLTRGIHALDHAATVTPSAAAMLGERAQLEVWYAWCRLKQGRFRDTIRWASAAQEHAEAAGDTAALAEAYDALFGAHLEFGRTPPRPYGELALQLFEQLGDQYRQARSLNHLGFAAAVEGRGADAEDMYRRSREAYIRAGDTMGAAVTDYNTGDLLISQGRLVDAQAVLTKVLPVFQSLGSGEWTASTRRELGRVAVRTGRVEDGRSMLEQARADLAALGLQLDVAEADAALVEVTLARGEWAQALTEADRALAAATALDSVAVIRRLHRHRATALVALGRLDEASTALSRALQACQEMGQADLGPVLVELAAVLRAQADPAADEVELEGREHLRRLGYVGEG
jgi:class 3 adenylate cyclase/tetratricopeptide (TPR) repeat protein